ncbi:MAG: FAD-dependent oxidoreductase, partial [Acidobacteria bacterium]|nr:FAD-dependent oxidoreductase [Acidobacteriota bacterium]
MHRRDFLQLALTGGAMAAAESAACDVFVYGSTPGGIAAAVEAARRGMKVVLACPKNHPGGMAASGLSTTDAVRPQLFGGFVVEFISAVRAAYVKLLGESHPGFKMIRDGWYYEPSVAEEVFTRILEQEQARLRWLRGHWLAGVETRNNRIISAELEAPDGRRLTVSSS